MDIRRLEENYSMYRESGDKYVKEGNYAEGVRAYKSAVLTLLEMQQYLPESEMRSKLALAKVLTETIVILKGKIKPSEKEVVNENADSSDNAASEFQHSEDTGVSFDDVIGCEEIKDFVRRDWIKRFDPKYEEAFSGKYATPLERGMLLYGLPGTGKTMIAQAIAHEVKAAFYSVDASKMSNKYVGETEKAISRLFDEASKCERAIIFIDEIDSILAEPKESSQNHEKSALNEWLRRMDGFDKKKVKNVICIGASNYPRDIAPSAFRAGRLGVHFRVELPTKEVRDKIIASKLDRELFEPDVDLDYVSRRLGGYGTADVIAVCARIKQLAQKKLIEEIDKGNTDCHTLISMSEVKEKLDNTHSSVSAESITAIEAFERNLNINNPNGSVSEYLTRLRNNEI